MISFLLYTCGVVIFAIVASPILKASAVAEVNRKKRQYPRLYGDLIAQDAPVSLDGVVVLSLAAWVWPVSWVVVVVWRLSMAPASAPVDVVDREVAS